MNKHTNPVSKKYSLSNESFAQRIPGLFVSLLALILSATSMLAQAVPPVKLVATSFGDASPSQPYRAAQQLSTLGFPGDHFARAYLGDGLLGIRPNPNPLSQSEVVAAGFVYSHPNWGFEMAAPAPDPLATEIWVSGSNALADEQGLKVHSQTLDLETGELVTSMTSITADGLRLDMKVTQFLARSVPTLMCQEIQITPSRDASIEVIPKIQREGIPGRVYRDGPPEQSQISRLLGLESDRGSRIGEAVLIPLSEGLKHGANGTFVLTLKREESGIFRTIAAVVTSVYHPAPDLEAERLASWGGMLGFDELRRQNRDAWRELWKSRVVVEGDEISQRALDSAFFYVHSSAHPSLLTGVPPFGTSKWSHYDGHVFWDMDSWILPAVLPADPAAVRAMVRYRAQGLYAAKQRAARFGFSGAMFPWEAGLDGSDVTPSFAATAWAEQHIVLDVAVGAWEYFKATGDMEMLHEAVWPIERDVANWVCSRGQFTSKGYEIKHIMGANEWAADVANESMVNMLCRMALRAAIQAARSAGETPSPEWIRVEKAICILVDPVRRVIQPFSQDVPLLYFNEPLNRYEEVSLQAHPEAYTLANMQYLIFHDPPIPEPLYRNTWAYEETLRIQRESSPSVPASERSPGFTIPPLAAAAAMFGDRAKAAELFRLAATEYVTGPFQISKEYRQYHDGAYITNQASLLLAAMYGFTGMRISEGDWRRYPVSLPEGWKRIEIQQVWIHGRAYHLVAEQGKPLLLELISHN